MKYELYEATHTLIPIIRSFLALRFRYFTRDTIHTYESILNANMSHHSFRIIIGQNRFLVKTPKLQVANNATPSNSNVLGRVGLDPLKLTFSLSKRWKSWSKWKIHSSSTQTQILYICVNITLVYNTLLYSRALFAFSFTLYLRDISFNLYVYVLVPLWKTSAGFVHKY